MRPRPGWGPRAVAGCGGRWLVREKPWAGICRIPGVELILRVWLIHSDLADSLVLGWFGEISLSLWCRLIFDKDVFFGIRFREWCNAGISRGYITERKFESFRGTGRCLSILLVQSGRRSKFLVEWEERERETTVEQKVALALRVDDAKMSLVVRRERESFTGFMQKG